MRKSRLKRLAETIEIIWHKEFLTEGESTEQISMRKEKTKKRSETKIPDQKVLKNKKAAQASLFLTQSRTTSVIA